MPDRLRQRDEDPEGQRSRERAGHQAERTVGSLRGDALPRKTDRRPRGKDGGGAGR